MNLLLKNLHIYSPVDKLDVITDLLISNGNIEKIGNYDESLDESYKIYDFKGITAVPGFFDLHVHFRDPGQTDKEDIYTGSKAAANGGFTSVLCMPNTIPPIDNPEIVNYLLNKSANNFVDIYVSGCATKNRLGDEIADLNSLKSAGIKAITDDGSPVLNEDILTEIFYFSAFSGIPFLQHAEDIRIHKSGVINEGIISEKLLLKGIPCTSESQIIKRDIQIALKIKNSKYHIQHLSCSESLKYIREAKSKSDFITSEICPHHFILTEKDVEKYGTHAKMNPPLRTEDDISVLLSGLADDSIDVICTDHAPHTKTEKDKSLNEAPFGIIGLETCFSLSYTYLVKKGIISFDSFLKKISDNPRKILGLEPVNFDIGKKANITFLDLKKEWIIKSNKFKSKSKNTPFEGFKVIGKPYAVINNNEILFSDL